MTRFNSFSDARESLRANAFKETQWSEDKKKFVSTKNPDAYLDDYARIAVFLCQRRNFLRALEAVSTKMWIAYNALPPTINNKFTRALGLVAVEYGFTFQNRIPMDTAHGAPIGIKLVAGDPGLGWMLRNKLFWKDSMDGRHGEHTHSLQWLAIAHGITTTTPAAELYSKAGTHRTTSKDGKEAYLWQWLADCFPPNMKAAGGATVFQNDETLLSNSFRSPQCIMDELLMGYPEKRAGQFIANYLFRRYKSSNRNWLVEDKNRKVTSISDKDIKAYGLRDAESKAQVLARGATPNTKNAWVASTSASGDARLLRNTTAPEKLAGERTATAITFHGIPGTLYMD